MRVLLIADVHANWESLLALQRAEPRPDALLFAGDAVGYGPDPANCARWLLANTTAAVRGNHDEALVRGEFAGMPPELEEAARETLIYARTCLSSGDLAGIRRWPATAHATVGAGGYPGREDTRGVRFYLTHGTPANPFGGALNPALCPESELHALFDDVPADVILLGHTHLPAIRQFGEQLIVNPGSLGQPRYGAPDATYAVWEDGHVQIKHLHYDHEATAGRLRLAPLSAEVVEQLSGILETGLV